MLQTPSKIEGRYGNGLHIYNPSDRHWVHFPMPTVMHEGAVNAFGVHLRASHSVGMIFMKIPDIE